MAVDYKDYYKILGVNKNASQKDIETAYRKLARKFHPDVNPEDKAAEERFKEINEAKEVLTDPEKRKNYDELSSYYQQYGRWPGAPGTTERGERKERRYTQYSTMNEEDLNDLFGGESPFSDFFETYFGSGVSGTTQGRTRRTGRTSYDTYAPIQQDVEADLNITLAEAYQGATRILEMSEPDGKTRRLEIKIPPGVDEGSSIRIAGQSTAGKGDLYLRVHMVSDPRFTREGTTLRTRVDVPLAAAMLGGEVHVPTPDGRRLLLRIPEGTTNGRIFRLRGQGMPALGQSEKRGDLYAEVNIALPTHLNEEQRNLFAAFARSIGSVDQATKEERSSSYG